MIWYYLNFMIILNKYLSDIYIQYLNLQI
jgi:hypothetical protein